MMTTVTTVAARKRTAVPITCRHCGYVRMSRAAEGQSGKCPRCGRKLPRVPVNARRPAPELDETETYAQAWASEPAWSGKLGGPQLAPADEPCPECGTERSWTPRRTALYCPRCKSIRVAGRVLALVERERARAELAPQGPSRVEQRQARVQLNAARRRLIGRIAQAAELYDPAGLKGWPAERAADLQATLAAYADEVRATDDEGELREIAAELSALVQSPDAGMIEQARAAVAAIAAPVERPAIERTRVERVDIDDDQDDDEPATYRAPATPIGRAAELGVLGVVAYGLWSMMRYRQSRAVDEPAPAGWRGSTPNGWGRDAQMPPMPAQDDQARGYYYDDGATDDGVWYPW